MPGAGPAAAVRLGIDVGGTKILGVALPAVEGSGEPVLLAEHEQFQHFMSRLYRVLLGELDDDGRVAGAMLSGAISTAVMHPLVADIDDETLRAKVIEMTRRIIGTSTGEGAQKSARSGVSADRHARSPRKSGR